MKGEIWTGQEREGGQWSLGVRQRIHRCVDPGFGQRSARDWTLRRELVL